ncbi:hypothetical protein [Streptomyces eurocidicus]|uniref:Secreted protein n=1 Tax=Streptomyces eurocidicus TaxID=66423 RepID=A0A7W8B667_STREU|nr:hypothetical protein [Streptomyces eurocidicus]
MSYPQPAGGTAPPPPTPDPPTGRREAVDRLRAVATTEPGRLRAIGALLALLLVAFGAVTAWQVADRASAADAVVGRSQPLSADAADAYRSLADADTTAASGFLAGSRESPAVRQRYEKDIALASGLLVKAAANAEDSDTARRQISRLNELLPRYTGLVESARANNRQGLPLGGAYLRTAGDLMRDDLLPAARELYEAETGRLGSDYADAKSWPWAALGLGLAALGALGWAQRRTYLRTNRVFNHGMLAATATAVVVLLWLVVGHALARSDLEGSSTEGARSLQVLTEARIGSLQARGDENLTLVARGAVLTENKDDAYEASYRDGMRKLVGEGGAAAAPGTLLARARDLADDSEGRDAVDAAVRGVREWQARHAEARAADDSGDYDRALPKVIGEKGSTGESFDRVDEQLRRALTHEQADFRAAADDGRGALAGLAAGAVVLAVLGAAGAVLGIGRRLSEYR